MSEEERNPYSELQETEKCLFEGIEYMAQQCRRLAELERASAQSAAGRQVMLAHREAKNIVLGTAGKLTLLEKILSQPYPERAIIFTNDNATVYKISQDFLIPAITHQTPVKECHAILQKFRGGDYSMIVVSHMLNEGVDVPDARVAVLLSGSGSTREYIQRLGRMLRKDSDGNVACYGVVLLCEVIAEQTSEEGVSRRRHEQPKVEQISSSVSGTRQLSLVPDSPDQTKMYKRASKKDAYELEYFNKQSLHVATEKTL